MAVTEAVQACSLAEVTLKPCGKSPDTHTHMSLVSDNSAIIGAIHKGQRTCFVGIALLLTLLIGEHPELDTSKQQRIDITRILH